jgi:hypothetical protein
VLARTSLCALRQAAGWQSAYDWLVRTSSARAMLWQLVVGTALLAQAVAQNPNPAANGVADKPPMGERANDHAVFWC